MCCRHGAVSYTHLQDEGGVTENADTEDSVDEEEKTDAETNDEPAMENSGQVSETTDDGITSDNNESGSSYENLRCV